jgi:hypothetical protein
VGIAAVQFDEGPSLSRTQIVHGARDQFLSGAGLPVNQDRRVSRRHDLDLLKDGASHARVPNDVVELQLILNFIFQIDFLARELLLKLFDLLVGERIVERDRNLLRDFDEQLQILLGEGFVLNPRGAQDSQRPVSAEERARAPKSESFACLHRERRAL